MKRFATRQATSGCVGLAMTAVLGLTSDVSGQSATTLVGRVRDSTGVGLWNVSITLPVHRLSARTDSAGVFRLAEVPIGEVAIAIRRLGYQPADLTRILSGGATDTIHVLLSPNAVMLSDVDVRDRNRGKLWLDEFYRRREHGIGTFLTRDEILERGSSRLTDVLATLPGMRVVRARGGQLGVRFVSAATLNRNCMPMIWLDGQRAPDMEVGELPVNEVEGIELYHGPSTTPLRFSQGHLTTCGTIVVWSRSAGP